MGCKIVQSVRRTPGCWHRWKCCAVLAPLDISFYFFFFLKNSPLVLSSSPCSRCSMFELFSAGSHLRWGVRTLCVFVSVFLEGEGSRCSPPLHQHNVLVVNYRCFFFFLMRSLFLQASPHLCLVRSQLAATIKSASARSINLQQKLIMSLKVQCELGARGGCGCRSVFWFVRPISKNNMLHSAHVMVISRSVAVFGLILLFCISTAPCQPCTDTEFLLAVCTSDFGKTSHIFKEICNVFNDQ